MKDAIELVLCIIEFHRAIFIALRAVFDNLRNQKYKKLIDK